MAKARKSGKKEKMRFQSRDAVIGIIAIVVAILVLVLIVWLMTSGSGRAVPRKSRGWQPSRLDTPVNITASNLPDFHGRNKVWFS
jgi:hypothetical protein